MNVALALAIAVLCLAVIRAACVVAARPPATRPIRLTFADFVASPVPLIAPGCGVGPSEADVMNTAAALQRMKTGPR